MVGDLKVLISWDAGVAQAELPSITNVVGKGRDEVSAVGDLFIKLYGLKLTEKVEYVPIGENIPGIQKILLREEAEKVAVSSRELEPA